MYCPILKPLQVMEKESGAAPFPYPYLHLTQLNMRRETVIFRAMAA